MSVVRRVSVGSVDNLWTWKVAPKWFLRVFNLEVWSEPSPIVIESGASIGASATLPFNRSSSLALFRILFLSFDVYLVFHNSFIFIFKFVLTCYCSACSIAMIMSNSCIWTRNFRTNLSGERWALGKKNKRRKETAIWDKKTRDTFGTTLSKLWKRVTRLKHFRIASDLEDDRWEWFNVKTNLYHQLELPFWRNAEICGKS